MFLLALGALAIGLLSFGIWLLPLVIIAIFITKILRMILKKEKKPDVVVMDRQYFENNFQLKEQGTKQS
jgi:ABC-type Na+ efflux pump permease subunit